MVDTDAELPFPFPLVDSIGDQPARPSSLSFHVDALGVPGVPAVPLRRVAIAVNCGLNNDEQRKLHMHKQMRPFFPSSVHRCALIYFLIFSAGPLAARAP